MIIGKDKVAMNPGIGVIGLNAALAAAQYIMLGSYDLRASAQSYVLSPPGFVMSGGTWKIAQDGATSLATGARRDKPDGSSISFKILFSNKDDATAFRAYCVANAEEADLALFVRDHIWYYRVWGINLKPLPISESAMDYMYYQYEVICYLYSPYVYSTPPYTWRGYNKLLPIDSSLIANTGHYDAPFESLKITCHWTALGGLVEDLVLSVGGESMTICDHALSDEIWQIKGNKIYETYEDAITSLTQWDHDTTGNGAYSATYGSVYLTAGQSAYYRLSGPNLIVIPAKMTAHLWQASGSGVVEVSPDAVSWVTALASADFVDAAEEYVLPDTVYMDDLYVRFRCISGTLHVKSIKFVVERWIEDDAMPLFPLGHSRAVIIAADANSSVDILGKFRSIQHLA